MINVVVDFSGSMRPNGKFAIVRNTCVALSMTTNCRFFKWNKKIEEIKIDEKFDWFSEFSDKAVISVLCEYLNSVDKNIEDSLLILTDGSFPFKEKKELEICLTSLDKYKYAIISIGADSLTKTNLSFCKERIFTPNDIYLVCEFLLSDEYSVIPKNLDELIFHKDNEIKNSDETKGDDWE